MNLCVVICELNPLHNGHEYIFKKAKELSGCKHLLAVMGGNFCQRAEPAMIDALSRTKAALYTGADMVVELPVIYAAAAADMFALGAVSILNTFGSVTHLVMGSECGDTAALETLAEIQAEEPPEYTAVLKESLSSGLSYARALTEATAAVAEKRGISSLAAKEILTKPNNILAIAYKKMLIKTGSNIKFVAAPRIPEHLSASGIRANFAEKAVANSMPKASYDITLDVIREHFVREDEFNALLLSEAAGCKLAQIAATPDCAEGLEHRIKKAANAAADYNEMLSICSSARYTTGRIKRICLYNLLKVTKKMQSAGYNYCRLLGIRQDAYALLSQLPDNVITNKSAEKNIPNKYMKIYEADIAACRIYSQITHRRGNIFYSGLVKV